MANIEQTKEALEFLIPFANAKDLALADGFQFQDIPVLVPALVKLPKAISGIAEVPKELSDLDDDERQELYDLIEGLEFKAEGSEKIAEKALACFAALGELIGAVRENRV